MIDRIGCGEQGSLTGRSRAIRLIVYRILPVSPDGIAIAGTLRRVG
jgi:hypothetical protein